MWLHDKDNNNNAPHTRDLVFPPCISFHLARMIIIILKIPSVPSKPTHCATKEIKNSSRDVARKGWIKMEVSCCIKLRCF